LIHEWKNTLCVHSKYKEDLVHIRDMHRLLSYKGERVYGRRPLLLARHDELTPSTGYRFKAFDAARAMASANPNEVGF
jgi:hypothetical protein